MLNLTFATWNLPAGTPAWRYVGNELDHIPLLLLFLVFLAHDAGKRGAWTGPAPDSRKIELRENAEFY